MQMVKVPRHALRNTHVYVRGQCSGISCIPPTQFQIYKLLCVGGQLQCYCHRHAPDPVQSPAILRLSVQNWLWSTACGKLETTERPSIAVTAAGTCNSRLQPATHQISRSCT